MGEGDIEDNQEKFRQRGGQGRSDRREVLGQKIGQKQIEKHADQKEDRCHRDFSLGQIIDGSQDVVDRLKQDLGCQEIDKGDGRDKGIAEEGRGEEAVDRQQAEEARESQDEIELVDLGGEMDDGLLVLLLVEIGHPRKQDGVDRGDDGRDDGDQLVGRLIIAADVGIDDKSSQDGLGQKGRQGHRDGWDEVDQGAFEMASDIGPGNRCLANILRQDHQGA